MKERRDTLQKLAESAGSKFAKTGSERKPLVSVLLKEIELEKARLEQLEEGERTLAFLHE